MSYNIYILTLIVLLFTACGKDRVDENKLSNMDKIISCQEIQKSNKFFNYSQEETLEIEPIERVKLLIKRDTHSWKRESFNKKDLYKLFQTEYYWASLVSKDFDYTKEYIEPQGLIDELKYKKDRWSFALTIKDYEDVVSQKSVGIGVVCQKFKSGCLVTFVRLDSPADRIDLKRGDLITKLNGIVATEENFYKEAKKKRKMDIEIIRQSSNQRCNGSITPREYNYKVVKSKTLKTVSGEKVGYLRLDSFLGEKKIKEPIETTFNMFKTENIEKLIIDLRYNGGGSVELASELLNKLSTNYEDEEKFTLAWNSSYRARDKRYFFKKNSNSLNLKQIIFLTTKHTASASELIISAMKPYLPESDVVIIGEQTHGKPVGMEGRADKSYYYFLINFVVKNSLGEYDYFKGIPVTEGCNVIDDPFYEMGNPNEKMLKTALHYIDEGSCK